MLLLLLWCNKRPFECQDHFVTDYLFPTNNFFVPLSKKNLKIEINFFQTLVKKITIFKKNPRLCLSYCLLVSCQQPFINAYRCQFHQRFTRAFFVQRSFLCLEFVFEQTFICKIRVKTLMKLTTGRTLRCVLKVLALVL